MKSSKGKKLFFTLFMLLMGILNIFPFLFMVSSSFKPTSQIFVSPFDFITEDFTLINYCGILSGKYLFGQWYFNTAVMTVLTIALKLFLISFTAYIFAKLRFRFKNAIFLVLLSSIMIPPEATLIAKYVLFKGMGLTDTVWGLVLPAVFDVYFVFMLKQFYQTIPDSLCEAARIDGCGYFKTYTRIIFPLARPALITMILFTFIWQWNDYMSPYIFITDPKKQMLSVGIKTFQIGQAIDHGLQMAATTLTLVPILMLFVGCQKYFVEGIATTGIKG